MEKKMKEKEVKFVEVFDDNGSVPKEYIDGYSMHGQIPIEVKLRDDSTKQVQDMVRKNFTKDVFEQSRAMIQKRQTNYYGPTDTWLYQALFDFPIDGGSVLVIGSTHPWYEIMALEFGAQKVTVVEYGQRETFHDKIEYKHPSELNGEKFDFCFNISSIEHDGLGRYGDALDPDADLKTMLSLKSSLKENGIMFLSIPVGQDMVFYNVHRVYGEKRFPLLVNKWEAVRYYGFNQNSFKQTINNADSTNYQPVVILRNK